jgi:hypothetical protein
VTAEVHALAAAVPVVVIAAATVVDLPTVAARIAVATVAETVVSTAAVPT